MKHIITLFLIFILPSIGMSQVQQETQKMVFSIEDEASPLLLYPDQSFEKEFRFEKNDYPVRRFLRVVGNIKMPGEFAGRGEGNFRNSEYLLDDYLDSINIFRDAYSLCFQGDNDPFEREAYNRISIPQLQPGKLTIELPVKREKLKVDTKGFFGLELQVYYKKAGRHQDDVYDTPDTIIDRKSTRLNSSH